jgi:hypothetical protein
VTDVRCQFLAPIEMQSTANKGRGHDGLMKKTNACAATWIRTKTLSTREQQRKLLPGAIG